MKVEHSIKILFGCRMIFRSFSLEILCIQKPNFRFSTMVKIGLQFKAFLENVTGLIAEGEDFRLVVGFLSLKDGDFLLLLR